MPRPEKPTKRSARPPALKVQLTVHWTAKPYNGLPDLTTSLLKLIKDRPTWRHTYFSSESAKTLKWQVARDILLELFGNREKAYMMELKRLGLVAKVKGEDGLSKWMYTDKWDRSDTFNNPVDSRVTTLLRTYSEHRKEYKIPPTVQDWKDIDSRIRGGLKAVFPWFITIHQLINRSDDQDELDFGSTGIRAGPGPSTAANRAAKKRKRHLDSSDEQEAEEPIALVANPPIAKASEAIILDDDTSAEDSDQEVICISDASLEPRQAKVATAPLVSSASARPRPISISSRSSSSSGDSESSRSSAGSASSASSPTSPQSSPRHNAVLEQQSASSSRLTPKQTPAHVPYAVTPNLSPVATFRTPEPETIRDPPIRGDPGGARCATGSEASGSDTDSDDGGGLDALFDNTAVRPRQALPMLSFTVPVKIENNHALMSSSSRIALPKPLNGCSILAAFEGVTALAIARTEDWGEKKLPTAYYANDEAREGAMTASAGMPRLAVYNWNRILHFLIAYGRRSVIARLASFNFTRPVRVIRPPWWDDERGRFNHQLSEAAIDLLIALGW